jgi:hypothetical protein
VASLFIGKHARKGRVLSQLDRFWRRGRQRLKYGVRARLKDRLPSIEPARTPAVCVRASQAFQILVGVLERTDGIEDDTPGDRAM